MTMALNNFVQWLLGLGIIVLSAFMLFSRADRTASFDASSGPAVTEDISPLLTDLPIKPVDAKTRACMADVACMQDFFLKVTLGNEYQPRGSADPRINKWQTPINYRIYGWERLDQTQADAMKQGLADMTRIAGLLGVGLGPSTRGINVVVLLTDDIVADLDGQFSELADREDDWFGP
jgi:hypothetical protein